MADRGNDIKPGYVLDHKNDLYLVVKIMHTQPGKGGAYIQAEMKNLKTGAKLNERFRSDGEVKIVRLDESKYQYIFSQGDTVTVMDMETFDQISVDKGIFGGKHIYLQEGMMVDLVRHNDEIISVKVPDRVVLQVQETESVIKGQTATSSYKPALLENGMRITVPQFIKVGDRIVVNTIDDEYHERAKEDNNAGS